MHVSHETIYQSLFVQARGTLRKELTHWPSKHSSWKARHAIRVSGQMLRAFAHQIPAQFSPKVALPCSHPRPPWLPFPEHLVVDWHYCGAQGYFTL